MPGVKVVHPHQFEIEVASGAMTRLSAISGPLTGAEGLHMAVSTIPPGCASTPHHHTNCESAIYVVSGTGRMLIGESLEEALEFGPGDCIYVPPFAIHQPVNLSDTQPVTLVITRNASEEIVEEYTARGAIPAY